MGEAFSNHSLTNCLVGLPTHCPQYLAPSGHIWRGDEILSCSGAPLIFVYERSIHEPQVLRTCLKMDLSSKGSQKWDIDS